MTGVWEVPQAWLRRLCSLSEGKRLPSRVAALRTRVMQARGTHLRSAEAAGLLPCRGWGSRSKPFLIIARLSEVMHLRASCDNRSWCWWFPSWKISCVKEKEEEKSRHKAGSQPSVELCWSVPCPQRKLHAHSASPSSCSVLCRQDTQDKLLYTSAPSRGRELWATRGDLGKDVHFSNCWRLPNAAQTAQ